MSMYGALAVQRRVLHALLMREVITRFGRRNLGVMWVFLEPMIFTVGIAAVWAAAQMQRASSIPIIAFAITGYSSVLLWRNCTSHSLGAVRANVGLLYHRQVRVIDVFLTRSLLEIAGASASFAVLSCGAIAFGWIGPPQDMLLVLFGWLMLAWFGTALALVVGAGTAYSEVIEKLWQPAAYLLFPISGAAFMVDWLPKGMRDFVLLLPMVHGVEMVREGYFGSVVRTHYDVGYMAACSLMLTLAGLYLTREAARRVGKQ